MNCELCGKEGELVKAIIEGTQLLVCSKCATFGKVLGPAKIISARKERKSNQNDEPMQALVTGYGSLIKQHREKRGLNQKEFAQKLAEKESIIHKIETESIEPDFALTKKLETFLKIKLIEQASETTFVKTPKKDEMTLGDLIKIKRR